jgi:hypothetical protein
MTTKHTKKKEVETLVKKAVPNDIAELTEREKSFIKQHNINMNYPVVRLMAHDKLGIDIANQLGKKIKDLFIIIVQVMKNKPAFENN